MATVRVGTKYPHYTQEDIVCDTSSFIYTNFPNDGQTLNINAHYAIVKFKVSSNTIYVLNTIGNTTLYDLAGAYGIDRGTIIANQSAMIQYVGSAYIKDGKEFLTKYLPELNGSTERKQYPESVQKHTSTYRTTETLYQAQNNGISFINFPEDALEVGQDKSKQFLLKNGGNKSGEQGKDGAITPVPDLEILIENEPSEPTISGQSLNQVKIQNKVYEISPEQTVILIKKQAGDAVITKDIFPKNDETHIEIYVRHTSLTTKSNSREDTSSNVAIIEYSYTSTYKKVFRTSRDANGNPISNLRFLTGETATLIDDIRLKPNCYVDNGGGLDGNNTAQISSQRGVDSNGSKDHAFIARAKATIPYLKSVPNGPLFTSRIKTADDFYGAGSVYVGGGVGDAYSAIYAYANYQFSKGYRPPNLYSDMAGELISPGGEALLAAPFKKYSDYPTGNVKGEDIKYYSNNYRGHGAPDTTGRGSLSFTLVNTNSSSTSSALYDCILVKTSLLGS